MRQTEKIADRNVCATRQESAAADCATGTAQAVPGRHEGRAACVIGAGPSLAGFDYGRCGDAVRIAINAMLRWVPADYGVFIDREPFQRSPLRRPLESFAGEVVAPRNFGRFFGRAITEFDLDCKAKEIEIEWPRLALGRPTAASLGVALAYVMGCRPIYLLGFDYRLGPKGERHTHAGGRNYEPGDLDKLRVKLERVLAALREREAELVNVTPHEVGGVEHGFIKFAPYSELREVPTKDRASFDLRRKR